MADERLIDKIMGLLAKAEGTDNEAEAQTFMEGATRLMAKHAIDDAVLQARGRATADVIGYLSIEFGSTYWAAWRTSANAVGQAFGFKCLTMQNAKNGSMRWYGWQRELNHAEVVWASILIQAATASQRFMATYVPVGYTAAQKREDKFKAKRSFISGFGHRVADRIREQRDLARGEALDAVSDGSLLPVLVSREEQLDAHFDAIPTKALRRTNMTQNWKGYVDGQRAGSDADIGNKSVKSRKALKG